MKNQLRFKAVLVLLVSILLLSAQAFAGSVKGTVFNFNTTQPVNGAMVVITGQGGPFTLMTDVKGNFAASTLAAGKTYTVTITKQTFKSTVTFFIATSGLSDLGTISLPFNKFNFQGGFIGANTWDFYIQSVTFGGTVQSGDEIAVLDNGLIVGVLVIDTPPSSSNPNPFQDIYKLTAYSVLADGTPGFTPGDVPTFRFIDASAMKVSSDLTLSSSNYIKLIGSNYMGLSFPSTYQASVVNLTGFSSMIGFSPHSIYGTISVTSPANPDSIDVSAGGIHTYTDASGAYTLGGFWDGNYTVKATKPGVGSNHMNITISGADYSASFSLNGFPGSISGKVLLKDIGAGIPGITVTAVGPATYTATTNSGGDYHIDEAVAGTYIVNGINQGIYTFTSTTNVVVTLGKSTTANVVGIYAPKFTFLNNNYDPTQIWTIYLAEATLDGQPLEPGDMIGFVSPSGVTNYSGIYQLTEQLNSAGAFNHPLTAFAAVATITTPTVTPAFPGWTGGATFSFSCYDFTKGILGTLQQIVPVATSGAYPSVTTCPLVTDQFSVMKLRFVSQTGILTGNVWDGTSNPPNQPLPGVTVTVGKPGQSSVTTQTDAAGHYEIYALSPSNYPTVVYTVQFTKTNYLSQSASANITAAGTTIVNGTMSGASYVKTQTIALKPGINWVSSNVNPTNSSFTGTGGILGSSGISSSDLYWVRNSLGKFTSCMPDAGTITCTWVNDIGNWQITEGYVFNMQPLTADSLRIGGTAIDPTTPIPLVFTPTTDINNPEFISFLPQDPMDASHAFDAIKTTGLVNVRNSAGKMLWQVGSNWVNNIGNLKPGEAYLVQVSAPITFIYPTSKSVVEEMDNTATHFLVSGNPANNVYTIYLQFSNFNAGDEIAILDGNTVVGATKLVNGGEYNNPVAIFSTLANGNGYKVGDRIDIRAWDASANKEYFVNYTMLPKTGAYTGLTYPSGDHVYSFANILRVPAGVNDNADVTFEIYPNPAHDYLRIVANSEISKVSLLNVLGQTVLERTINAKETRLEIGGTQPGVYIVKLEADGKTVTQKVFVK